MVTPNFYFWLTMNKQPKRASRGYMLLQSRTTKLTYLSAQTYFRLANDKGILHVVPL
jgi:hypothetical protein